MKLRLGFVSNSSSSSFVLIVEKEAYDEAKDKATPYIKKVLSHLSPEKAKLGGKEFMVLTAYCGQGGEGTFEYVDGEVSAPGDPDDPDCSKDLPTCSSDGLDMFIDELPKGSFYQHTGYN